MRATPILDGEQPLPVRKVRWLAAILVGLAAVAVMIALDHTVGLRHPLVTPRAIALFIPAFYLAVFAHELGHLIAGVAVGFEPRTFMVGVFLFNRDAKGWRFRFVIRNLLWGGLTAAIPASDENLVSRYRRFVVGGPAASLVLLLISLVWPAGFWIREVFWVNLLLMISVCIPYTTASLPSDSKLLLLLGRKGPVRERLVAVLYLLALDAQGKQPGEWPLELVRHLDVDTMDKSRMPPALALLLAVAAQNGETGRVPLILERALTLLPKMLPDLRRGFLSAAACYHGFENGDAAQAEEWLGRARQIKGGARQKDWDSKALAGIFYAKGDHALSASLLTRYIALLERQPRGGIILAEAARMRNLLAELTAQSGESRYPAGVRTQSQIGLETPGTST